MQRKIFAILLALIMALSLTSVSAFAAEIDTPVDDPVKPEEYTRNFYYQDWTTIFNGDGRAHVLEVYNHSYYYSCWLEMYEGSTYLYGDTIPPDSQHNYYVGNNVTLIRITGIGGPGYVNVAEYPAD